MLILRVYDSQKYFNVTYINFKLLIKIVKIMKSIKIKRVLSVLVYKYFDIVRILSAG